MSIRRLLFLVNQTSHQFLWLCQICVVALGEHWMDEAWGKCRTERWHRKSGRRGCKRREEPVLSTGSVELKDAIDKIEKDSRAFALLLVLCWFLIWNAKGFCIGGLIWSNDQGRTYFRTRAICGSSSARDWTERECGPHSFVINHADRIKGLPFSQARITLLKLLISIDLAVYDEILLYLVNTLSPVFILLRSTTCKPNPFVPSTMKPWNHERHMNQQCTQLPLLLSLQRRWLSVPQSWWPVKGIDLWHFPSLHVPTLRADEFAETKCVP